MVDVNLAFGPAERPRSKYHPIELFRTATQWYLGHDSELAYQVLKDPGSWECMEVIYENKPRARFKMFPGIADRIFLSSPSCKATRNRKDVAGEELGRLIKKYGVPDEEFNVMSLGSGPGHDIINALYSTDGAYPVFATCLDTDEEALEYGRKLVEGKKLANSIRFVNRDVTKVENEIGKYDVISIIGLIEYLSHEEAIKFLSYVNKLIKPKGRILTSNMRKHPLEKVIDFCGRWVLSYKLKEELEEIVENSGFVVEKSWYEPEGIHSFVVGKKSGGTKA